MEEIEDENLVFYLDASKVDDALYNHSLQRGWGSYLAMIADSQYDKDDDDDAEDDDKPELPDGLIVKTCDLEKLKWKTEEGDEIVRVDSWYYESCRS